MIRLDEIDYTCFKMQIFADCHNVMQTLDIVLTTLYKGALNMSVIPCQSVLVLVFWTIPWEERNFTVWCLRCLVL